VRQWQHHRYWNANVDVNVDRDSVCELWKMVMIARSVGCLDVPLTRMGNARSRRQADGHDERLIPAGLKVRNGQILLKNSF